MNTVKHLIIKKRNRKLNKLEIIMSGKQIQKEACCVSVIVGAKYRP